MKEFAVKFLELRKEAKLSQAQIAKALGVSFSIVCYWETDKSEPSIVNLVKIAKFFNVSADYLLGLSDFEW
ncbi:MAG: helix-turn-helix domain-containing protein [Clostridiaceae bacterium]|jgi:transcriptional regulator with XRE-family HTH domain|nr:helix-turn-helix domain-containing protein [Clostridiaceae bacterium]